MIIGITIMTSCIFIGCMASYYFGYQDGWKNRIKYENDTGMN